MTQETTMPDPIDLVVTYTDVDLVNLQFSQAGERLLWVNLTRDKAIEWAGLIVKAAGMHHKP